jgi:formate hydrogenlyase subunit 3/multisubunit Na+/H+ antiporter MnhD subunit
VNGPLATLLLGATWAVPFALMLACMSNAVRRAMPQLLWFAPLPGLAASVLALPASPLEIGASRLRLVFELDGPGALLLGVAALLWSAAGAYAATYMRDTPNPGRFVACWLMACTGCLGVFVAGDLVSLYAMLAMLTLGASGIHTCIGTRPALVPKPTTSSARIRSRSGEPASAAAASRRRRLSPGISPASITSPTSSTDSASSASTR